MEDDNSHNVKVQPTPIALIIGTHAPLLAAPKQYWTLYLLQMTSAFSGGETSVRITLFPKYFPVFAILRVLTCCICIQRIKSAHDTHTNPKRSHNGQRKTAKAFLQTPCIQQHGNGKDDKHANQSAVQAILRQSYAVPLTDILLHCAIG